MGQLSRYLVNLVEVGKRITLLSVLANSMAEAEHLVMDGAESERWDVITAGEWDIAEAWTEPANRGRPEGDN